MPMMFAMRRPGAWVRKVLGCVGFCAAVGALYFHIPAVAYYWFHSNQVPANARGNALWLSDFVAQVQARPVAGVRRNLSGLTYSTHTHTLFATTNRPAEILELNTDGDVLRRIRLHGVKDTEGITHLEGTRFAVSDESASTLHMLELGPDTREVTLTQPWPLPLEPSHANLGVETVSWDGLRQRLWVGQEKWPLRLLEMRAEPPQGHGPRWATVHEWQSQGWGALFINDLASLTTHEPSGNLLLLSEESAMVVEYTQDGRPVSLMPLWRGLHGLDHKIPQPEGMALAPDGRLFIVSEPNLFYRFGKDGQPEPANAAPV